MSLMSIKTKQNQEVPLKQSQTNSRSQLPYLPKLRCAISISSLPKKPEFDLHLHHNDLPLYDAVHDKYLHQFFGKPTVQRQLTKNRSSIKTLPSQLTTKPEKLITRDPSINQENNLYSKSKKKSPSKNQNHKDIRKKDWLIKSQENAVRSQKIAQISREAFGDYLMLMRKRVENVMRGKAQEEMKGKAQEDMKA